MRRKESVIPVMIIGMDFGGIEGSGGFGVQILNNCPVG